ncbi:MAG TPA: type II toxin-antitoxin system RelE/ParE family toxin [Opitutales bacterium]|jgi:toxin ParE1/3/4|nr:type II toxin-antitoxin system RelE/ParE family toxin [Opitutales bacterium]
MGLKVILTPRAIQDLHEIADFIAADNPVRAVSFGDELIEQAGEFPNSGRIVPEIEDARVREVIYKAYRIIYRNKFESGVIYNVRFWHAARGEPNIPSKE